MLNLRLAVAHTAESAVSSAMKEKLRTEWQRFRAAVGTLDRQTMFVLTATAALVIVQHTFGSRRTFRQELAPYVAEAWQGLLSWGWWFGMQGVTGFVLPAAALLLIFKRRPAEIGLGLGDFKLALVLAVLYLPFVVVGTWVLSDGTAFQAAYPHYAPAARDWGIFILYELLFLFYWVGWEYLWRGFVLFGTAHTFGFYSIFIQMVPFAILHVQKPFAEGMLSIVGGLALGVLVWRCRSFWIAVPIHAAQMFILDFWCALRIRTGIEGTSPAALLELLAAWLG